MKFFSFGRGDFYFFFFFGWGEIFPFKTCVGRFVFEIDLIGNSIASHFTGRSLDSASLDVVPRVMLRDRKLRLDFT